MDNHIFYELAAKVLTGEASETENRRLQKYLEHPEYRKTYQWLQQEWQKEFRQHSDEFSLDRGLYLLRKKIKTSEQTIRKAPRLHHITLLRIAAAVILFLGISYAIYHTGQNKNIPPSEYLAISSTAGERKQITLPDGSIAYLNAQATLRYPETFDRDKRRVELHGKAFFEVRRNPEQPFVVYSGDFETTVLGTTFEVCYKDTTHINVTVATGKVRVAHRTTGERVILTRNDHAAFDAAKQKFTTSEVHAEHLTDWHRNILHFDEITVKQAFALIEKWYGIKINCTSEAILTQKIRASYHNESLENVLQSLQFMTGFEYRQNNDTITIK